MDILAKFIVYAFFAVLILAGVGFIVRICQFFYYRQYRSDSVKVYYDDNDHRKGYYIVKRPRGPYPVGYPKEKIIEDMEEFERLKREEKAKRDGHADMTKTIAAKLKKPRPMWLRILLMTPSEYMDYKRQRNKQS